MSCSLYEFKLTPQKAQIKCPSSLRDNDLTVSDISFDVVRRSRCLCGAFQQALCARRRVLYNVP